MIKLDAEICNRFETSASREWLETNGIGGYASSTISGANTRRYHGLLVAATKPPLGRMVLLSKFEETVTIGSERFDISSNQYPGLVYPEGHKYLTSFRLDPFPVWTFETVDAVIERSVFMIHGENSTVCRWKIISPSLAAGTCMLELKPLLAFRDFHQLLHEDAAFDGSYKDEGDFVSIRPYPEMPALSLAHNAGRAEGPGCWYRNFEYAIERERGFDYSEDLFQPFTLVFDLSRTANIIASTERQDVSGVDALEQAEIDRRRQLVAAAGSHDGAAQQLAIAADQFIVARGAQKTVIAGYHWFSDWGRDTMIGLNGLTLASNRPDIAKSILTEFSKHISEGMLPNRFPDAGDTPEYNTVDATLWFFEAVRAYCETTGDYETIRTDFYDKLSDIIVWHIRGTRYQIHVDTDGLLFAGEPGVQLTWMDAKIGDWVVTPRTGKAVEIQALWYNALCIMADLAKRFNKETGRHQYSEMARFARESFTGQFWNEQEKCLFDVVNGSERDGSIRPNQIFSVSLPYTMLDAARSRKVVDKVESELLTPVGLRSLSPGDPNYVPIYIGSPHDRDAAYHQGTVWGWLIGPFVDAYRKVHSDDDKCEARVAAMILSLKSHLTQATVGQVSEIFDADPPHHPRGCAAQAWSVAELLRISSRKK